MCYYNDNDNKLIKENMSRNKKQSSKTEISKQKQAFRHTAEWRDFRAELIKNVNIKNEVF